jgi:predicted transcriptional regulator
MASYPNSLATFTTKVNSTDTVDAAHPNLIQAEVVAIETAIGQNPQVGTISSSFVSTLPLGTDYTTLNGRLANIEAGIIGDAHTQYMKRAGGETITSATSSTKGLIIKGAASQSVNLQEWQNSSETALAYITPAGGLVDTKVTADINNLYVLNYVFG